MMYTIGLFALTGAAVFALVEIFFKLFIWQE